jgi:sigma-B regulation protein RsbQ
VDVLARNNVALSGPVGAPAIVFAHGLGCDQSMWRHAAPAFARDHRVVLFDHVGFGGSDVASYDARRHAALDGYADDVVELLEELDLGPAVFVGHSVSSMIGVLAANRRPDLFDRLVLVGPSPRYVDDDGYRGGFSADEVDELLVTMDANYLGWSRAMAPAIMGVPERPELGDELTASFCRTDPGVARRFARATFLSDNRADLEDCPVPALVLQCREDVIAPVEVGRYVADRLPDATFVLLDAVGHCPNLSAPDQVVAAVQEFVTT